MEAAEESRAAANMSGRVWINPPSHGLSGYAEVPRSKPHMQRALILSLLANEPSIIVNPDWSSESRALFYALKEFGMRVDQYDTNELYLTGVGRSLKGGHKINVGGSAFNFRALAALACLSAAETVIEGNVSMLARPVKEHLKFISELGGALTDESDARNLRVRINGGNRLGERITVDTEHSSQVLTSALMIAPFAREGMDIHCGSSRLVGEGYVHLTQSMMRARGASVERDGRWFFVKPTPYRAQIHYLASDFTAMSYLAGIVAASEGTITVSEYEPSGFESELDFVATLGRLGINFIFDPLSDSLRIEKGSPHEGKIEIDGHNIPTVIPSLAALAPFIDSEVNVRNVAHVNNHKCPRVDVMIQELRKLGVRIDPIRDGNGNVDGFATAGRQKPLGGVELSSQGDHRIFLSLATATLGAKQTTVVEGAHHTHASFPKFLTVLDNLGIDIGVDESDLEGLGVS